MSLQLSHAYAFIGGAFVGRFGGIIPSIIVSGVLLYVADPTTFTTVNMINIKNNITSLITN